MVATSVTTADPGSALPDAVSQSTRIDLRPLGLIAGAADRERPPKERLPGSLAAALSALDQGSTSSGSTTWPKPTRRWRYGTGCRPNTKGR